MQRQSSTDVLHFATHGYADFETPRHSGLLAASGEMLTIQDFFEKRLTCPRLAVLSACETAIPPELESPDEIIALPTSLMVAGIPAVIGSLWSVAD
ncbi:CHAT domain-containing protein, partial [Candidatus Parcubacteria bacterium]